MKKKRLLFAGDSAVGGAANYLLAVLKTLPIEVLHIPPHEKISLNVAKKPFDAYIFSDYAYAKVGDSVEQVIVRHIEAGAGLLMIGGWASFTGSSGKWSGSSIEKRLPVECLAKDDRINHAAGLLLSAQNTHPMLKGISFAKSPVICGLNEVKARKHAQILLTAQCMQNNDGTVELTAKKYPLLVVSENEQGRAAALTTDLAPHWCGGWVDWGTRRQVLPVDKTFRVEVGNLYTRFVQSLISWLVNL